MILNGSPLPIWDVKLRAFGRDSSERATIDLAIAPPGPNRPRWPGSLSLVFGESPEDLRVELEFRDAAGRTWKRSREGVLNQTGVIVFGELAVALPTPQVDIQGTYTPPAPQ